MLLVSEEYRTLKKLFGHLFFTIIKKQHFLVFWLSVTYNNTFNIQQCKLIHYNYRPLCSSQKLHRQNSKRNNLSSIGLFLNPCWNPSWAMANNNMIGVLNLYIQKPRNKGYYDIKIIGCLSVIMCLSLAMDILITMSDKIHSSNRLNICKTFEQWNKIWLWDEQKSFFLIF